MDEPQLAGEVEIEEQPGDVWRSLLHGSSLVFPWFVFIWLSLCASAILDLQDGKPAGTAAVLGGALTVVFAAMGWALTKRVRAARRYRVRITDEYLGVAQEASEIRLFWAAIQELKHGAGLLSLRSDQAAIVLPWYRMSDVQKNAIEARLSAYAKKAQATKKRAWSRVLLLWLALVVMFVVVYHLVSTP